VGRERPIYSIAPVKFIWWALDAYFIYKIVTNKNKKLGRSRIGVDAERKIRPVDAQGGTTMVGTPRITTKRWVIIGLPLAMVLIAVGFLGYNYLLKTSCEGIFQQTQLNLASSIEVLQMKGEIGFANDKIQDLTEKAQLVALNYKACCVAADNGLMPENKFLECKQSAGAFELKVAEAAQLIQQAREAKNDGASQTAEQKSGEALKVLRQSDSVIKTMPKSVLDTQPSDTSTSVFETEREPNNDLFQGTAIALTSSVSGELSNPKDIDTFHIKNSSKLRDWISVKLENRSQKMTPEVEIFDANRRSIAKRYETTAGASLAITFVAEAAEDYYVIVRNWSSGAGPYTLKVKPAKYHDEFEPNDIAAEATPMSVGQSVEATILDTKDADWYRLKAPGTGNRKIYLQNIKGKLTPQITVFNADKSQVFERYDTTEGANLSVSVDVPTNDFYVRVTPWSSGWGRYSLTVK
jgi:hypothetical protein